MTIKIAAAGMVHYHIFNQVDSLLNAGATLSSFYEPDPEFSALFMERYPQARRVFSVEEILEDQEIQVVVSAAIPHERAPLGMRVMQHEKDFLCAKPGFTSLAQLAEVRRVQAETRRIYAVYYGERFGNAATVKAGELVQAGAIGQVIQTVGFGPHRLLGHAKRQPWAFDRQYFGGILNDLASHQMDQFLYFTGSTTAQVVAAQVGNFHHKQFPAIHDFGDITVRSASATGYVRVDWLTPAGLNTWGDVRLFILGTTGYIEIRKNTDLAGREGGNHLFIADGQGVQYINCEAVPLPFGTQFIQDVLHRTETAMSQAHCFLASELALQAEAQALELQ